MAHELLAFAENWIGSIGTDLARYVVFAFGVWFVLWIALAPLLRGRKIRPDSPGAKQMTVEFFASLRSIAIFSTFGLIPYALSRFGVFDGHLVAERWGPVWFWASLIAMIVAHDAYFYWVHRIIHRPQFFRAFHRRHHKSMNPSPFSAYSFDIGEAALMGAFVPMWVLIVPTHWEAVGLFVLHQIVRNTMGHSGYELSPATKDGKPLFDWMTTTTHHDLHHAQAGYNYGLYFTWWDRWMGTEHPEYHARFAAAVRKPAPSTNTTLGAATAAALLAVLFVGGDARAQTPSGIMGDWATRGFQSVVRFAPCPKDVGAVCGKIVWTWEQLDATRAPTDRRNPNAALRNRPIAGVELITGLRETAPGVWTGGARYNPDDGRTYTGEIRLQGGTLMLRGCALNVICQTQIWRRPEDVFRVVRSL